MLAYVPRPSPAPAGLPPLWLVANGDAVVGPVSTTRLVRGVRYGKIPDGSMVRERSWTQWRHVERIREIAALRREQAQHGHVEVPRARCHPTAAASSYRAARVRRRLTSTADPGAVLLVALAEIMRVTDACVGAIHRARAPHIGLVTSSTQGPGMHSRLGHVLPGNDPSLAEAAYGRSVCSPAGTDTLSRCIRDRLGGFPASASVAMVPLVIANHVYAMVELGRADHNFRLSDMKQIRLVVDLATERLERVQNAG